MTTTTTEEMMMIDSDIRDLIAEAEARIADRRFGKIWARETDKDLVVMRKLINALEATLAAPDGDARERLLDAAHDPGWEYARQNRYGYVCEPDDSREQAEYRASLGGGYDLVVRRPIVTWEPLPVGGESDG